MQDLSPRPGDELDRTWAAAVAWLRGRADQHDLVRDAYLDDPLTGAADRFARSDEWRATRVLIGSPGRALDVGAGRGIASYALARDGWVVDAVEPDPDDLVGAMPMARLAQEQALPISVHRVSAEALPFDDASFDLVYGRQVLHHFADLRLGCAEMARVLRPGGRFVAVREHVIRQPDDLQAFLDAHPLHHRYGGERAYSRAEYVDAILAAGVEVTDVLNPLHAVNRRPRTNAELVAALRARLPRWAHRFVRPRLVAFAAHDRATHLAGRFVTTPGAPYGFVGTKR